MVILAESITESEKIEVIKGILSSPARSKGMFTEWYIKQLEEELAVAEEAKRLEELQPYQQRVINEKKELDGKLDKWEEFIEGEIFQTIPTIDKLL